ncbi:alpha-(1,6)-fucosyltransferase-like isoform X2 [Amphiura filiformis]|uniref:alpha-(1,6)-fucosyltransferase-like isoform X2 n=1 Tax=Amphiura filiformis TaxID=82378 RepID=UPI003B216DBC
MKTSTKLGLVLGSLWLCSLLYLGGNFFPPEDGTLTTQELDHLTRELHRIRRQNDDLRRHAAELRDLVELRDTQQNNGGDQVLQMQQKLEKANKLLEKFKDNTDHNFQNLPAPQHQMCGDGPTREHEVLRRKIDNGVTEMWYYVKAELNKIKEFSSVDKVRERVSEMLEDAGHHQRAIHTDLYNLSRIDGLDSWRENEAKALEQLVQKRFHYLQNPKDCSKAKKLVCYLNKGCGYGCQVHHVTYCFIVAYATQRTLILESKGWRYAREGWEKFFLPLSSTCKDRKGGSTGRWGAPDVIKDIQVVDLPIVDGLHPRPDSLPLAIPEDLFERLTRLHGNPIVWWLGQILRFLLRPQPELEKDMKDTEERLGFGHPIVGVHVRRTDKVGTEAAFHGIEEYMSHVEEYFQRYAMHADPGKDLVKRVFLATDDPGLLPEAQKKYPEYTFVSDNDISKSAGLSSRYSESSLRGIILDIHFLSLSDYLVCTFSSQVCRVAYEIMQTHHPDAAAYYHSLDDVFYYGGQNEHQQIAIYEHKPRSSNEIELKPGDVIGVAGNHWDGWSKGTNHRLKPRKAGLYPSYKVVEKVDISKMPTYPGADDFTIPSS